MPHPPAIFPKLYVSSKLPESMTASDAMAALSSYTSALQASDPNSQKQNFRTKRKHVLKAARRLQKLTKPPYSFVEMLESHHALVVKALQQLYTHCINNKCFPGEPIEIVDGYPLTHAILDRLGLIKQAEAQDAPDKVDASIIEAAKFWKNGSSSSNCSDSDRSPPELSLSPSNDSQSTTSSSDSEAVKCKSSQAGIHDTFNIFGRDEQFWPNGTNTVSAHITDFHRSLGSPSFNHVSSGYPTTINEQADLVSSTPTNSVLEVSPAIVNNTCQQPVCPIIYPTANSVQYSTFQHIYPETEHQNQWTPQAWAT
ncbi:hypothetical protein FQN57_001843 [Myotisia sp. PD_48]|nr:hypothetical protein FQN57_001843 [Myotisia sp. PD_48]